MAALASGAMKRAFVGAVKDDWIMYSDRAEDFTIGQPIGFGASSTVHYAQYRPAGTNDEPVACALKVIDLDILPPHALPLLRRETQLMALSKHPNVLRVRGSWMDGHKLFIALRLMRSGSVADVMHYASSGGFEEEVVKAILVQALQGLNYLHVNGCIHRDIKGANLLLDDDGTVLLGDLGVAASMAEDDQPSQTGAKRAQLSGAAPSAAEAPRPKLRHKRKSFVGTPCWMAPEVISQKHYDSKADMWSFGITALELAQGRPPNSREPSHRALMKIIQDAPPTLDRDEAHHKFSKSFSDMVESCLEKDPSKRPTAEQLLATPFFKSARKKSFLVDKILTNLPPLKERQERRQIPSMGTRFSVASWDFTTTIHGSPTSTHHHYSRRQGSTSVPEDAVFEMEDDSEASGSPAVEESEAQSGELKAKELFFSLDDRASFKPGSPISERSLSSGGASPELQPSPEPSASSVASSVASTPPIPSEADALSSGQLSIPVPAQTNNTSSSPARSPSNISGGSKLLQAISNSVTGKSTRAGSPEPPRPPKAHRQQSFNDSSGRPISAVGSGTRKLSFSQRFGGIFSSSS
ncbi:kinase-like domain-containing protein [Auriculariales sp. MPI-PUGE-AT-0066]|nr:kinase-like domain-containing protein [Auriculariales sp. MPI-PUGE-AT-0066]